MNNRKYLLILGLISTAYIPNAKADLVQCLACSAGTYGKNGKCIKCEEGYYSDTLASTSCKKCNAGTYSNSGDTSCTDCPTGYKCPDGKKIQCEEGTISKTTGSKSCTACKEGTYAIKDRTYCGDKWTAYKSYKIAGTYTKTLPAGMYKIEIAGAGAGGGATSYNGDGVFVSSYGNGKKGCNGEKINIPLKYYNSQTITVTVGAGGKGGISAGKNQGHNKQTAPTSGGKTTLLIDGKTLTAGGGTGKIDVNASVNSKGSSTNGEECKCEYSSCTYNGGDEKKGKVKTSYDGNPGSDGYVIIYKADDDCYSKPNGTGCTSSTSTGGYYGGGCS